MHGDVNLGIAVDLDFEGLVAPVVRQADGKRLRAIAREINDLAGRARSRQLRPDDITGGTFTITNPGQYGTMMQFPIINQPQVAILSTDGVKRKPWVVTDAHGRGVHRHPPGRGAGPGLGPPGLRRCLRRGVPRPPARHHRDPGLVAPRSR